MCGQPILKERSVSALPPASLRARLAHGAFWSLAGTFAVQGFAAASTILVARVVGRTAFGEYGMIQSTLGMMGVFAGMSLGYTASRYTAQLREQDPHRAGGILALAMLVAAASGLATAGIVFAVSDVLARSLLEAPHLGAYLRIASPLLICTAIAGVQTGALAGLEAFKQQTLFSFVVAAVQAILLVAGALLDGVRGALIANVVGSILALGIYNLALRTQLARFSIRTHLRGAFKERSILWSFALPSMLVGLSVSPVIWLGNTFLVSTPGGYADLALFNAANQWRTLIMFLPSVLTTPLLPIMSQLYGAGQFEKLNSLLLRCLLLNVSAVTALSLVVAAFSHPIMRLYGPSFVEGSTTLYPLLAVAVLLSAGQVVGNLLVSRGAMWTGFGFNVIWAAALLASAWLLVGRYGSLGLAISYAIAYALHTAIQLVYFVIKCQAKTPPC